MESSIIDLDLEISPYDMANFLIAATLQGLCTWRLGVNSNGTFFYRTIKKDLTMMLDENLKFSIWLKGKLLDSYENASMDDEEFRSRLDILKASIERSRRV